MNGICQENADGSPCVDELFRSHGGLAPPIVELSRSEGGPTVFLFHASDGGSSVYAPMEAVFRGRCDVYAVEDPLLDAKRLPSPGRCVEAMAQSYLKVILRLQPEGPYYLGGYSFGGLLALVIAQLLQKRGASVGHLFLMETHNPAVSLERRSLGERVEAYMTHRRRLGEPRWRAVLALGWRAARGVVTRLRFEGETRTARLWPSGPRSFLRQVWLREHNTVLSATYAPRETCQVPCDMWLCEDQGDKFVPAENLGWDGWLSQIEGYRTVPGNHLDFMRPESMRSVAMDMCSILGLPTPTAMSGRTN